MAFISTEIISQIREQTDIISLIGEYVRLIPSGRTYKALCPFHTEKTPSFHVIPDKQIYHCFGCGKGGDVFTFVMESEHLTYPEAIRYLADKCGIEIPKYTDPDEQKKDNLYDYLNKAAEFYVHCLKEPQGEKARDYIKKRHLSEETVKKFRIGYSPDSWDALTKYLGKTKEDLAILERCGLIKLNKTGDGYYDVFRNRLMIPILDIHGRVCSFGGRVMTANEEPKYLNGAETETFNKRKMLFNMREAIPVIRRQNAAIVVEGYMDVISLWQNGIKNAVASLGTAISAEQIQLLARNCDTIYFSYDADEAGQKATLRAISVQKGAPINARIIAYDDPKDDPDSFVSREGGESFKKLLEKAKDIYTFLIETRTRSLKFPLEIPVKEKIIQEFRELIPTIHSLIARSEIIRKISKLLDMEVNVLERELTTKEETQSERHKSSNSLNVTIKDGDIQRQEWVLKHLLEHPEDFDSTSTMLTSAVFSDNDLRKIFEAMSFQQEAANFTLKPAEILSSLDEPELVSRLSMLITTLEDRPDEPFSECVKGLVKTNIDAEIKRLQESISEAEKKDDYLTVAKLSQAMLEQKRKIDMLY